MTSGECIYRKIVNYMFRMACEKDDFGNFVLQEIGSRCIKVGNGPLINIHREVKQEVTIDLIGQKGRI